MMFLIIIFLAISACTTTPPDIHSEQEAVILKIAKSAERKKYFNYAAILREKYQKRQPRDYESMKHLAFDLGNAGKWQKSIHYLNKINKSNPGDIETVLNLGHAYAHIGAWENAFYNYSYVLQNSPSVQAYNGMGVVLDSSSHYKMALACFDIALSIDPNNSAVLNNRALTLAMLGKKELAVKALSSLTVIENSPYYQANLNMVNTSKKIWPKLFKTRTNDSIRFYCKKKGGLSSSL